jgi:hypothetical protein
MENHRIEENSRIQNRDVNQSVIAGTVKTKGITYNTFNIGRQPVEHSKPGAESHNDSSGFRTGSCSGSWILSSPKFLLWQDGGRRVLWCHGGRM